MKISEFYAVINETGEIAATTRGFLAVTKDKNKAQDLINSTTIPLTIKSIAITIP